MPLLNALVKFDLQALWQALQQDGLILLGTAAFAAASWYESGYYWGAGRITVQRGVLLRRQEVLARGRVAVVEIRRPLWCRMLGASKLVLYFKARREKVTLCLRAVEAQQLADEMMPLPKKRDLFRPVGGERLRFAALSANIATTAALVVLAARRTADVLGEQLGRQVSDLAISNLEKLEKLAENFLPMGAAWAASALFVLASVSVLRSLLETAGFTVCRNGGVILVRGGLFDKLERRVLAGAVTACDVRLTPTARLLRRRVVYLQAGGYRSAEPLLVYRRGDEAMLRRLMPEFETEKIKLRWPEDRSLSQFIWKPAALGALLAALAGVAAWAAPGVGIFFSLPALAALGGMLVSAEAYFCEGAHRGRGRTLALCFGRFVTRHEVYVFGEAELLRFVQHPLLRACRRANLWVKLPCGVRYRVRAVPQELQETLAPGA